jgi:hypothetical protein
LRGLASLLLAIDAIAENPENGGGYVFDRAAVAKRFWENARASGTPLSLELRLLENAASRGDAWALLTLAKYAEWETRDYALALAWTDAALRGDLPDGLRLDFERRRERLIKKRQPAPLKTKN